MEAIEGMIKSGTLVICCGGGGIPVFKEGNHYKGAPAVIDKDSAASLLASDLDVDMFIILTAVEKIALNYNKPNQVWLDKMSVEEAEKYRKIQADLLLEIDEREVQYKKQLEDKEREIENNIDFVIS